MPILVRPIIPLVGLLILTGCAPAQSTAAPAPTPTVPTCTPLDGGTPFPCTQADFDSLAEQRALYDEAEAVVKRFAAEDVRQAADWRLREMTPEFEATTTGDFRAVVLEIIRQDRAEESRRIAGSAGLSWIRPAPKEARDGSLAVLEACLDTSVETYVTKESSTPSNGVPVVHTFHLVRDGSQLKISNVESLRVEAC